MEFTKEEEALAVRKIDKVLLPLVSTRVITP